MSIVHGRLAVVVVNYASARLLERNLAVVEREARAIDEDALVIVVDNWAGAGEREAAATVARAHGWTLIASPDEHRIRRRGSTSGWPGRSPRGQPTSS
ncbi:hypothetical protein [Microbacterium sp. 1S1]|uniref:hypothetical protein n=1 Tax=Microbacterium sp. 1S1 TaxID=2606451 RepID=UPI0021CCE775|nr:hypothetical protein [Microbacterium sp. 1S1]